MRKIDSIIIHCTATPEGKAFHVNDVRRWHTAPKPQGNGWADIGYHFLIALDGTIEKGRDVGSPGAHCLGLNATGIGVCYVGGLTSDGKTPKNTMTAAQKAALVKLCRELMNAYDIPAARVYGHNEFARKACPAFDVKQWKQEAGL